jgi:regulator of sigma E protease
MFGIAVGIVLFVFLILAHELGHFIAARRNGVEVEEFGIGFPPKIWGKKMGKGLWQAYYTINLLPIGGFVRLKGENESDKSKGSYGAARLKAKTKISLAGVTMNVIIAWVIFSVQAASGMPQFLDNQYEIGSLVTERSLHLGIAQVIEDSPADQAGLKNGIIINSIAGIKMISEEQFAETTAEFAGDTVIIDYIEANESKTATVTLEKEDVGNGYLGVTPFELKQVRHNALVAPIVGAGTTIQFGTLTFKGFLTSVAHLLQGDFSHAAENLTGPVGIFSIFNSFSALGISYLLFFAALISVALAVMNILPLPALDGGRLILSYLASGLKKPLSQRYEEMINLGGFVVLLIIAILITIVDIGRL